MPENIHTFQMNLGELETEVLKKLFRVFSEDTNGWPPDTAFTGTMTRTRVRRKLNQALTEIAVLTNVLKGWFVLPVKQNYSQYPAPLNVFDVISPVYFFTSATNYEEIDVYDESELDSICPGWRTETGSIPSYAYTGFWNRTQRFVGLTPTPNFNATAITLDSTVVEKVQPYGAVEAVSGSATAGSSATAMVDADGQNFSELGIVPGLVILNTTDGSRGTITTLSTTNTTSDTINCSGGISGGNNNTWAPGDEFRIIGGGYGGFIEISDTEATYLVSPWAGDTPFPKITMANGNLLVRCYVRPVLLRDLNQYPELPPELHITVAERAAGYLCQEFPVDTAEYKQGQAYIESSNGAIGLARQFIASQFKDSDRYLQSRRK